MAPKSRRESEEEQMPPASAGGRLVSCDSGPPAHTPTDTTAPSGPRGTEPHCPPAVSANPQLAPEALDPHTLRLLWGQRELEIQALRWAVQNGQHARHQHILKEVAGLPSVRSSQSQDKFLQNQVQKLTLELQAQKEQARLEKAHLEQQLAQTLGTLQQLEGELQAFQKSCLLQLARSSWVGRILRSQTGSVEVVTAETLMDTSDLSENEQSSTMGEGFRLEDVDWNSIAHRFPNFFNVESSSEHKQLLPQPSPPSDTDADFQAERSEKRSRSLQLHSLHWAATSSSGGAESDSSSGPLALPPGAKRVAGEQPQATGSASEQIVPPAPSVSDSAADLRKPHKFTLGKMVVEPGAAPDRPCARNQPSPGGFCLKIVAVSIQEKFIRILNQSLEETVDLGGCTLQQLPRGFPVCQYRFPPGTLLAPQHHITVWGEGTGSTRKQSPLFSGQDAFRFHSGRGCVTLLRSPEGQVLSQHQAPHCESQGSRIFTDNTDWSIDRFPLPEAWPAGTSEARGPCWPQPQRKGPGRETRAGHRKSGTRAVLPFLSFRTPFLEREALARPEGAETRRLELLPTIPEVSRPSPQDLPARKESKVRVCRKSVDGGCPMVALSVQSSAESRFGFRFLSCPPITEDSFRRL